MDNKYFLTTRLLLLIQSVLWAALALIGFFLSYGNLNLILVTMSILMLVNCGLFAFFYVKISFLNARWFYFLLGFLVLNLSLYITDQFGLLDFAVSVLNLGSIAFLLLARKEFLRPATINEKKPSPQA